MCGIAGIKNFGFTIDNNVFLLMISMNMKI